MLEHRLLTIEYLVRPVPASLDARVPIHALIPSSPLSTQIREQNRQDIKSAGPQSQLLASVIAEKSRSPVQQTPPPTEGEAYLPPGAGQWDP